MEQYFKFYARVELDRKTESKKKEKKDRVDIFRYDEAIRQAEANQTKRAKRESASSGGEKRSYEYNVNDYVGDDNVYSDQE